MKEMTTEEVCCLQFHDLTHIYKMENAGHKVWVFFFGDRLVMKNNDKWFHYID